MRRLVFTIVLALVSFVRLGAEETVPKYWPLQIGKGLYMRLELALTEKQREDGLMNRTSMPSDGGMVFVFEEAHPMAFWMKNTLIPLDILFLDSDCKVVAMHRMEVERPKPPYETEQVYDLSLKRYPSEVPAQFAIELNAGQISKCGIKVGQIINLRKDDLLKLLKKQ